MRSSIEVVARLDSPLSRSREDLEREPAPEVNRQAQDVLTCRDHIVLIYPGVDRRDASDVEGVPRADIPLQLAFCTAAPGRASTNCCRFS
jgi:hypothetical protein